VTITLSKVIEAGSRPSRIRRLGIALRRRPVDRGVAVAVAVGFALRLGWVCWTTRSTAELYSDQAQYLSMASQISQLVSPSIGGRVTALYPLGYPLLLSPVAFLARHTGWFSLVFGAALVNVAFGTFTVWSTSQLALRWFGSAARLPAASLMAVAPAQIYFTSVALTETVFTALLVGLVLFASTRFLAADGRFAPPRMLIVAGVFVGFATLVRSPGALVLVILVVSGRGHSARPALARALGWVVLGALIPLAPVALRNAASKSVGLAAPSRT